MSLMKTFESLSEAQQKVVREMSDAARNILREAGINPRNDDHAALFDEACAKFYVSKPFCLDYLDRFVNAAFTSIDRGDPVEAASTLDLVLKGRAITPDHRKIVEKAHEEITIGSPEKARALLELLINR
jgi:hypothetical protein